MASPTGIKSARRREPSPEPSTPQQTDLTAIFMRQRADFQASPISTVRQRRRMLLRLQRAIETNRAVLIAAANADFGTRAEFETQLSEIIGTVSTIRYTRRNLGSWARPRRRSASMWFKPAKNRVAATPLGVIGVVSPWNFPVHLALIPAATALAAEAASC
jgi:acyl-CoA reductase-like NAD-dependent aldehyde dehydrogenase